MLDEYGYGALPRDTVISHIGWGARNLVERCFEEYGHGLPTPADRAAALATFSKHYRAGLVVETVVYPTLTETLHTLAATGCPMALVTNKPEEPSVGILELLGLSSCFETVIGGDTLPTRKPDPAQLLLAIERCQADPDRVVMIGDASVDVEAARHAGVSACGVGWGLGDREAARNAGPDWWIEEPETLSEILLSERR